MNGFTSGLITGSVIGAISLTTYALCDRKTRKKVARDSKKMMDKANGMIDNISHMF